MINVLQGQIPSLAQTKLHHFFRLFQKFREFALKLEALLIEQNQFTKDSLSWQKRRIDTLFQDNSPDNLIQTIVDLFTNDGPLETIKIANISYYINRILLIDPADSTSDSRLALSDFMKLDSIPCVSINDNTYEAEILREARDYAMNLLSLPKAPELSEKALKVFKFFNLTKEELEGYFTQEYLVPPLFEDNLMGEIIKKTKTEEQSRIQDNPDSSAQTQAILEPNLPQDIHLSEEDQTKLRQEIAQLMPRSIYLTPNSGPLGRTLESGHVCVKKLFLSTILVRKSAVVNTGLTLLHETAHIKKNMFQRGLNNWKTPEKIRSAQELESGEMVEKAIFGDAGWGEAEQIECFSAIDILYDVKELNFQKITEFASAVINFRLPFAFSGDQGLEKEENYLRTKFGIKPLPRNCRFDCRGISGP